jgi:hypothetical protein
MMETGERFVLIDANEFDAAPTESTNWRLSRPMREGLNRLPVDDSWSSFVA